MASLNITLDHCVIATTDLARADAFYAKVLEAEVSAPRAEIHCYRIGMQQLNCHGPGIPQEADPAMVAAKPVMPGGRDLCFVWNGPISGAAEHLAHHGVAVETGPVPRTGARGEGITIYFRDPDGSLLELSAMCRRKPRHEQLKHAAIPRPGRIRHRRGPPPHQAHRITGHNPRRARGSRARHAMPHASRERNDHRTRPGILAFPLTTCPGAEHPLAELIRTPIGRAGRDFFAGGRARRNCTHMLDLAWLASNHATRTEKVRDYEADIPDEIEGCTSAILRRNGDPILEWRIDDNLIKEPAQFAGCQLYTGFTSWILDAAAQDHDLLEASLVLQKACFVTSARRYRPVAGPLRTAEKDLTVGVCHGYAATTIDTVEQLHNFRDFSDHPEDLLRFL